MLALPASRVRFCAFYFPPRSSSLPSPTRGNKRRLSPSRSHAQGAVAPKRPCASARGDEQVILAIEKKRVIPVFINPLSQLTFHVAEICREARAVQVWPTQEHLGRVGMAMWGSARAWIA